MRLVTFSSRGDGAMQGHIGLVEDDVVLSLTAAGLAARTMVGVVRGGDAALRDIVRLADLAPRYPLAEIVLAPPLMPGKALCSGINYKKHANAAVVIAPTEPFFFAKLPSSFVGHDAQVMKSPYTNQFDYEVELAAVIGKPLHHAREDEVMPARCFWRTGRAPARPSIESGAEICFESRDQCSRRQLDAIAGQAGKSSGAGPSGSG